MEQLNQIEDDSINIFEYLRIVRKNWFLIACVTTIIFLIGAYRVANITVYYQASCTIRFTEQDEGSGPSLFSMAKTAPVDAEIIIMKNKDKILNCLTNFINAKSRGVTDLDGIAINYMSKEEVDYLKELELSPKTKKFILSGGVIKRNDKLNNIIDHIKKLIYGFQPKTESTPGMSKHSLIGLVHIKPFEKNSPIVQISAKTPHPELSVTLANIIAIIYSNDFSQGKIVEAASTRKFIEEKIEEINQSLDNKRAPLEKYTKEDIALGSPEVYKARLSELLIDLDNLQDKYTPGHALIKKQQALIAYVKAKLGEFPVVKMAYERIKSDWETNKAQLAMLEGLYVKARIDYDSKLLKAKDEIQIIAMAENAGKTTQRMKLYAGALIVGLMTGVGLAILIDSITKSIAPEEIESITGSSVLSTIPSLHKYSLTRGGIISLIAHNVNRIPFVKVKRYSSIHYAGKILFDLPQMSNVAEAYRSLRTNLLFALGQQNKVSSNIIAITSAGASEGKTVNSLNLGITVAKMGIKTLVVNADMRNPKLEQILNIPRSSKGLSEILMGKAYLEDCAIPATTLAINPKWDEVVVETVTESLSILTCGARKVAPGELLVSSNFRRFINEARAKYDLVIIDTPPCLPVSDTSIIGSMCDGIIPIYKYGGSRRAFEGMIKTITMRDSKVIGTIINQQKKKDMKANYGYGYGYGS